MTHRIKGNVKTAIGSDANYLVYHCDMSTVIGQTKADFILTDPPYDVDTEGGPMVQARDSHRELKEMNISSGFDIEKFLSDCINVFRTPAHYNMVAFALCAKYQHT